jgi:hypothetical protein
LSQGIQIAAQKKSATKMIPVVMEPRMKDNRGNWTGLVMMELGNILYVDFSNDNDFQSAIQQLKAEILSRTNPLWVLRTKTLTPVVEVTTPPPLPGSGKATDADLLMIEQLSSWLNSLNILSEMSRNYAEILTKKNTGSIAKLRRKLERNSNYLEEIGGFDGDDIIDIKEGLKLQIVVTTRGNDSRPTDIPTNMTRSKTQSVTAVTPTMSKEGEEDLSMLVEKSGKHNYVLHSVQVLGMQMRGWGYLRTIRRRSHRLFLLCEHKGWQSITRSSNILLSLQSQNRVEKR